MFLASLTGGSLMKPDFFVVVRPPGLRRLLGLLLLLLTGATGAARAADMVVPPPAHPARIKPNFYFNSVTDVDAVSESFQADFYLFLDWEDPRSISPDPARHEEAMKWNPNIDLVNV